MRITGRQWVMPVLLLLLLAGTVAVQHSEWSHTIQLVCTWGAFFIVIIAGICHGQRQRKKEIAARKIRDEQKINEMQVLLESLKRSSICLSPLAANAPTANRFPQPSPNTADSPTCRLATNGRATTPDARSRCCCK